MRSRKVSKCCSASTVVGTSTATCLPSMTALKAARMATSVLPKADVAADQAVHRPRPLHVAFGRRRSPELVRRFAERETSVRTPSCHLVSGPKAWPSCSFALGLHRQHFSGVVEDGGGRIFLRPRPFHVRERTEWRRLFSDTDIARNEICLLERDVEFRFIGKL